SRTRSPSPTASGSGTPSRPAAPRTARPSPPAAADAPRTPKPRPHIVHEPDLPSLPLRLEARPGTLPTGTAGQSRRQALAALGGLAAMGVGYMTWSMWDRGADGASDPGARSATGAAPGSLLWTASKPSLDSPASYSDGTLYVGGTERLYALDPADGQERWSFAFGLYVPTRTVLNGDGDTAYFAHSGGTLRAVDTTDGTTRWTYRLGSRVLPSDPALAGSTLYIATSDGLLHAVDAATGGQRWTAEYRTAASRAPATPVATRSTVYVGGYDGELRAYDTRGRRRWTFRTGGPLSSPVMWSESLYVSSADGKVYAVDITTGARRWAFPVEGETGGLALVGTGLYFHNRADTLYAVHTQSGRARWTYPLPSEVQVVAAASSTTVYLGHRDGTLRAVDTGSAKEIWTFEAPGRFLAPPTPTGRVVYFTTTDGDKPEPRLHAVAG
ncbi:PQQ-binding-like beta-propeller repeat protein, partial [Streptomyces sp. MUM 203J]